MRLPQSSRILSSLLFTGVFLVLSGLPVHARTFNQQLQSSPSTLTFGSVELTQSLTQPVTLTNTGRSTVSISKIVAVGSGFSTSGLTLPASVPAGTSVVLNITFTPSVTGFVNGQVTVTSNASNVSLQIGLQGNGLSNSPLTGSPSSLSFGQVTVGSKSVLPVILSNPSSGKVVLTAYQVSGIGYSVTGPSLPLTLRRGQSATLNITFAPQTSGTANGSVFLPGAGLTIPLTGSGTGTTAGQLSASPTSLAFGSVTVGSNQSLSGTITNTGGSSVSVSNIQISGTAFSLSGINSSFTLTTGQSATFSVNFAPTSTGTANGSVTVSSNASNPTLTIALTGTGIATAGQLTVSPSSLAFGNVDVGSTTTQASTLSASGGSVTVSSAASSNSQYSLSGASFPLTLNSGQSAQLTVTFAPTTSGSSSATLTYTTSTSTRSTESASGTGVTPQHTVDLSWNASTSSVAGYNVYRGTTSGVYTRINSSLDPGTSYSDSTVAAGVTYYYAATAVNSSGQESAYSTPIQVTVP